MPQPCRATFSSSFYFFGAPLPRFQHAPRGTILWKPGDAADFAFLLVAGHCEVFDEFSDHCHGHVETNVPGQFAGELNLFTGESRKNKLVATQDLKMWTITRSSLKRMQREAPLDLVARGSSWLGCSFPLLCKALRRGLNCPSGHQFLPRLRYASHRLGAK